MSLRPLGGCFRLIAYLLVALALTIFLGGFIGGTLVAVFHAPFHRVLDRLLLGLILGQVLLFETPNLKQFWAGPIDGLLMAEFGKGALLAGISVTVAVLLGITLGDWEFQKAAVDAGKLGQVLLAIVLVPLIEETLFRGIPLKASVATSARQRIAPVYLAIALAALIYAAAHFVKISEQYDHKPTFTLQTAWEAEKQGLEGLQDFPCWRGLNLWLIGVILGLLYLRFGRLWANLGAHAVWILALLLLPIWLQEAGQLMDVSATAWVTGPLLALTVWEFIQQMRRSAN